MLTEEERDRVRQLLAGYRGLVTDMDGTLQAFRAVMVQLQHGVPEDEILTEIHLYDIDDSQRRLETKRQHVDDLTRFFFPTRQ